MTRLQSAHILSLAMFEGDGTTITSVLPQNILTLPPLVTSYVGMKQNPHLCPISHAHLHAPPLIPFAGGGSHSPYVSPFQGTGMRAPLKLTLASQSFSVGHWRFPHARPCPQSLYFYFNLNPSYHKCFPLFFLFPFSHLSSAHASSCNHCTMQLYQAQCSSVCLSLN